MWYFQGLCLFFLLDIQIDPGVAFSHTTGRKKYFAGSDKVNGIQAFEVCRQRSMKLATIRNEKENEDIQRLLVQRGLNNRFYTSGKKLSYGGAYSWLDGKLVDFFSWNAGEPNGYLETESCIIVFINNGALVWDDQPCDYPDYYVCESADEETSIDEDDSSCISEKISRKKYYLGTEKMTYYHAIQYCEEMFMQLATVKNAEETASLHKMMLVKGVTAEYWISADQKYGSNIWRWRDGKIVNYFNWNQGEPNNEKPRCMAVFRVDQDVKWNDAPCNYDFRALCEKIDPNVEIHVNRKLISSNKWKFYPSQSEYLQIFLDLPKNNFLLGWDVVRK